jgi:hypothetical protein
VPEIVIDTNVAMVANGEHAAASDACVLSCINALIGSREQIVLVDSLGDIFREYQGRLSHSGQPGVGDAFFKWIWSNQANPDHCRMVEIHRNAERVFEEFPDDERLEAFDRSDRKFVAVALASGTGAPVLNAVDGDWAEHEELLSEYGLVISQLC